MNRYDFSSLMPRTLIIYEGSLWQEKDRHHQVVEITKTGVCFKGKKNKHINFWLEKIKQKEFIFVMRIAEFLEKYEPL